jgi:hypothetical protein
MSCLQSIKGMNMKKYVVGVAIFASLAAIAEDIGD